MFGIKKDKSAKRPSGTSRRRQRLALYNYVQTHNVDGGQVRRPPRIEVSWEESPVGGGLQLDVRYKLINGVRELMRNSDILAADIGMLTLQVVGERADLMFFDRDDKWFRDAERAWRRWSKHCGFKDNCSLTEFLDRLLYTLLCEGDAVVYFDGEDEMLDTGRILFFAPDQITHYADFDADFGAREWTQVDGVFRDKYGRTIGVCIAPKPGMLSVSKADNPLILLKDDPYEIGNWVYIKRTYRDTVRGVADVCPTLADLQDCSEILFYEKLAAKRAASEYAWVTEAPAESAVTPEGFIDEEDEPLPDGAEPESADKPQVFEISKLQDITGGMIDLLPNGSSVQFADHNRPSPRTLEFVEAVREMAGNALKLTRSYGLGQASGSYSSARWDSGVSAKAFNKLSTWLDNNVLDWLADRVINWHIRHKLLDAAPDENWVDTAAFTHPTGREVLDETKEIAYKQQALRGGFSNLQELVGPHYKQVLRELAEEKKYAESLGLTLDMSETKSGQVITPTPVETGTETETTETVK